MALVYNVAAFVRDAAVRETLINSERKRSKALAIAYALDGYQFLPLNRKNKVYDFILSLLDKGIEESYIRSFAMEMMKDVQAV